MKTNHPTACSKASNHPVAADVRRRTPREIIEVRPPRHLGGYVLNGLQTLLLALMLTGAASRGAAQPVITQQPRNQTNVAGTTAIFSVVATGTPPLSYQWRSHANPTTFTNIPSAIEATLTLTNVQPIGRRFGVVVTDGGGLSVTSSLATFTVLVPPVITAGPTNESVFPGVPTLITLRVTATGTAPLQYQWMFNSPTNPVAGATNATLAFFNLQPAQAGNYFVRVTNAYGAATSGPARVGFFWAPMTGTDIPALARLDTNMQSLLFKYGIPGGALAVVKDGRLVFARGYGLANTNTGEVVQPDSLFRMGSLGKAITAAATLKLVEEGKINLTNSAFGFLNYPTPTFPGAAVDSRLGKITLQNLLNHTEGWDVNTAVGPTGSSPFSPFTWGDRAAHDLGLPGLADSADVIRWSTGFPLQFEPGTRYVYANIGYQILGRVIEKLTGEPYEDYVRNLLAPVGITRMRISGDSILQRHPGEVVYYDYPTNLSVPRAISFGHEPRFGADSLAYAYSTALYDAAGGWASSPIDHLRFISAVDGRPSPPDILSAPSIEKMTTATSVSISAGQPYGMGWTVNFPGPGDWEHNGGWYGTASELVHRADGITFMYVFNFRPYLADSVPDIFVPNAISTTVSAITAWPTNDLFPVTLSYDAWRAQHFSAAELADPAISGDSANPDGDDSVNLLEYATGTNPRSFTNDQPPTGSFVTVGGQRYFALTFRRLMLGYELNYVVEASDDLVAWSPVTEPVGAPHLNPDGTQTVTIRESTPADTTTKHFLRLRVSRQ